MALDHPENKVSPLWEVAIADGKYRQCPYLQSNRQGQCWHFRKHGPLACHCCGFRDGLDVGYDMGSDDGYREGRIDEHDQHELEEAMEREMDRWEAMD